MTSEEKSAFLTGMAEAGREFCERTGTTARQYNEMIQDYAKICAEAIQVVEHLTGRDR